MGGISPVSTDPDLVLDLQILPYFVVIYTLLPPGASLFYNYMSSYLIVIHKNITISFKSVYFEKIPCENRTEMSSFK